MAVFWFWFTFLFAGIRHLPHVLTVAPRDSYTQSWEDLSPFLESGCCYSGNFSWLKIVPIVIIIIMYIYRALINALSAHIIHININMIFYTHVEHSPTKTIYIKYYKKNLKNKQQQNALQTHTHTHARERAHTYTDCSRNWVLILVRMEIL